MKALKNIILGLAIIFIILLIFNTFSIYNYSKVYSEKKSDFAIVLGAGTSNGVLSPVFKERINHGIYLFKKGTVDKIIFTGGTGEGQKFSDSKIARVYAIKNGIPSQDIFIEESSRYTHENLVQAKSIIDSLNISSALIVSDPLHMKRSMAIAQSIGMNCESSPTKTSMYKSTLPKFKSLLYETFFYTLGKLTFRY